MCVDGGMNPCIAFKEGSNDDKLGHLEIFPLFNHIDVKTFHLQEGGEFALVGEAVAPGFDFHDFSFGDEEEMSKLEGFKGLENFVKPDRRRNFHDYYEKEETK